MHAEPEQASQSEISHSHEYSLTRSDLEIPLLFCRLLPEQQKYFRRREKEQQEQDNIGRQYGHYENDHQSDEP